MKSLRRIIAARKAPPPLSATPTDAAGNKFDPSRHLSKDGAPVKTKAGLFRLRPGIRR